MILPIEVAVGSVGVRDARAIVDITTELPMLIESVGRNLRVGGHAEEEAQIEHPLTLLDLEEVAHVLNQLALNLVPTLLVATHGVSLLR